MISSSLFLPSYNKQAHIFTIHRVQIGFKRFVLVLYVSQFNFLAWVQRKRTKSIKLISGLYSRCPLGNNSIMGIIFLHFVARRIARHNDSFSTLWRTQYRSALFWETESSLWYYIDIMIYILKGPMIGLLLFAAVHFYGVPTNKIITGIIIIQTNTTIVFFQKKQRNNHNSNSIYCCL